MHNSSGISLIELLLVVVIISTLGIFSASFYARFLTQNEVVNTVDRLIGSFRKAQVYSMMGKQNGTWGVRYTLSPKEITLYLSGNSAFDETYQINSNITISYSPDIKDITFARITGLPSAAPTITIAGNNSSKTITVNSQGVVSRN